MPLTLLCPCPVNVSSGNLQCPLPNTYHCLRCWSLEVGTACITSFFSFTQKVSTHPIVIARWFIFISDKWSFTECTEITLFGLGCWPVSFSVPNPAPSSCGIQIYTTACGFYLCARIWTQVFVLLCEYFVRQVIFSALSTSFSPSISFNLSKNHSSHHYTWEVNSIINISLPISPRKQNYFSAELKHHFPCAWWRR